MAILMAPSARAQGRATVRGTVVQADSATPAPGVVVALVDTSGAEVARALTDPRGVFVIGAVAGRYAVRALKIGYRPTSEPPFDVTDGETHEVRVVLRGEMVQLEAVRVEGESSCRIRDDSARVVATLWDQARGVLAASTLTSGGESYRSVLVRYRNLVPVDSRRVVDEAVSVVQAMGPNGFIALSPDSLAAQGFIVTAGQRSEFRAPDAAVLLSPSFAIGHCFHVVPPPSAHPEWVGVEFGPVRERRGFSDIRGDFWIDRASSELRKLEYTYLNVPSTMMRDDATGWVEFAQLPTGEWIVSQWAIRTPVTDPGSRRMPGMPDTLIAMRTAGGITRTVVRGTTVLYENYLGALAFHLVAGDSLNTTSGSRGVVVATERSEAADSTSTITFTNIPPGRYTFRFRTPFMEWIGAPAMEVDRDVADTTDEAHTVRMPASGDLVYQACGHSSLLYGFIVGDNGQGVPFGYVHLRGRYFPPLSSDAGPRPYERLLRADAAGRWRACVPAGVASAAARVGSTDGLAREQTVMPGSGLYRIDLVTPDVKRP